MKTFFSGFLSILLLTFCILSMSVNALETEKMDDALDAFSNVSASAFFLMDGFTGAALSQRNCDISLPMASTTKIMTCIVALERASLSDLVVIPKEAVGIEGSSVYLKQGESLTLEELLFALMLESANDAAVAIALHVSESIDDFALLMNEKAKVLGMRSTNYRNPHGLPCEGHYSSARDLCKLLAYGMQNEAFRVFVGTGKTTISAPNSGKRFLSNHNKLLRIYDSCVGGKTGFTKEAGRCLVTAAEKKGRILICATLGDPNDWIDHVALFDYGFSLLQERKILSPCEINHTIAVIGGVKDRVQIQNPDEYSIYLRDGENVSMHIEAPVFIYADVRKGQAIGSVVLTLDEKEVARFELVSTQDISKREDKLSFWQKIKQIIGMWIN